MDSIQNVGADLAKATYTVLDNLGSVHTAATIADASQNKIVDNAQLIKFSDEAAFDSTANIANGPTDYAALNAIAGNRATAKLEASIIGGIDNLNIVSISNLVGTDDISFTVTDGASIAQLNTLDSRTAVTLINFQGTNAVIKDSFDKFIEVKDGQSVETSGYANVKSLTVDTPIVITNNIPVGKDLQNNVANSQALFNLTKLLETREGTVSANIVTDGQNTNSITEVNGQTEFLAALRATDSININLGTGGKDRVGDYNTYRKNVGVNTITGVFNEMTEEAANALQTANSDQISITTTAAMGVTSAAALTNKTAVSVDFAGGLKDSIESDSMAAVLI